MGYNSFDARLHLAAVSIICAAVTVAANSCKADSSPASSSNSIPSATDDVKAGDWVNWQVTQPDALTPANKVATQSSGNSVTPSGADIAAAVVKLQNSISAQLVSDATAAAAAAATQSDKDKQQADLDALVLATAAIKKAGDPTQASTDAPTALAAAQQVKDDAQTALDSAVTKANLAAKQSSDDQTALSGAKSQTPALKDAAAASAKAAASTLAAESAAKVYRDAATSAYTNTAKKTGPVQQATYCAPTGSRFLVTNVTAASSSKSATSKTAGGAQGTGSDSATTTPATVEGYYPSKFLLFHFQSIEEYPPPRKAGGSLDPPTGGDGKPKFTCGGKPLPSYDTLYQFPATPENIGSYDREGFTWGAMVIPYKFYVKDKTFKGNPSTVGFVGYQGWVPGLSLAGVLALGPGIAQSASSSSTPPTTTKSTSTSTAVTYTAATGVIATFSGVIKAGFLVGWDWQGSGNNFQYEGKTWIALSVGASF